MGNFPLKWTKTSEGYEAKSAYGHYEAKRFKRKSITRTVEGFDLIDDGHNLERHTLLRDAKEKAQSIDDARHDAAEKEADARVLEAMADATRNEVAQEEQGQRYERLEREHMGCPKQGTGIFSPEIIPARTTSFSAFMRARQMRPVGNAPHLMIRAAAGTGKTTTLVQGLVSVMGGNPRVLRTENGNKVIVPSPQQEAIWEALRQGPKPVSTCFVAFNKSIADELQRRVPPGCNAMTMHSMGSKAIRNAFQLNQGERGINKWRTNDILSELIGVDSRQLSREEPVLESLVCELVRLCKLNLVDIRPVSDDDEGQDANDEALKELADHYGLELGPERQRAFAFAPRVLERCLNVAKDGCIDFNDMIWLPVALNLPVQQYDLLLVDEAQDLNRCQQELVRRAGKRLVFCGDPRQAIYGFAGADAESMPRMRAQMADTSRGVVELPLNVTRRCGKAIVQEANKIVPDFFAHEDNGPGVVRYAKYTEIAKKPTGKWKDDEDEDGKRMPVELVSRPLHETYLCEVAPGDMVLCRVNAPLVSQCFKLIGVGRKATIQGRDIGTGLIKLVEKLKATDVLHLITRVHAWAEMEVAKEQSAKRPNQNKIMGIHDRADCLLTFCSDQMSVDGVLDSIRRVFTDNPHEPGVRLSSIHKAKGLEADRVYFIRNDIAPCPHPLAKTPWEREQEMNLVYVAVTRAIKELIFVV